MITVGIAGTGFYLPERVLRNADLEKMVDTSDEWIVSRTGIRERRIASDREATSDLAISAAREALRDGSIDPEEIDLIIVCTSTPDMLFPATACIVQEAIGAKKAGAFDLEACCTGFVYGLSVGSQFIKAGTYKTVLVIGADIFSRIIDWTDRNTCILFADGAGAAVLKPAKDEKVILATQLGSDGSLANLIAQPAGGSRQPATYKTIDKRLHYLKMDGRRVFRVAVEIADRATRDVLEECSLSTEDIDCLILHQANARILEAIARRLELPGSKVFINLDRYGNASAASIAIALAEVAREGQLKKGSIVVIIGFGSGMTWASCVIKW
ncbi:ketoacyl-ACP synthase III [candidate division NPL-UPA2 bacterium Unc8]|uniref:Beta-ketoacyl-[acyl-carrier-protein] synthase III n=1 Tax=candidate division NPL-UPA2 bacterium Unc8 TaxID=1980939 RepID=A0A399FVI4_UNCN2|nr:3-oxoacyl-(acyl-carrier-protein) synthase 3 [Bacillota bacterium]MBT9137579.1 3-oxoacyl-(acyl-carrier-protein) synthase 3 [Bacillota bacterium]MBT9146527.1 3-oxoacyl-(acyl-carrier-protein) synthase 3 [Bacillota bacterium]RII00428.1 MAG: ketoacyl-ACP synthase III [candidate division NPL-UPA2 bacterium Unc8]